MCVLQFCPRAGNTTALGRLLLVALAPLRTSRNHNQRITASLIAVLTFSIEAIFGTING